MLVFVSFIISMISATSVTIVEPVDGETYDGDWLPFRAIVENENELPDSVHYSLNGAPVVQIPRLNTDWPTYMQNYQNHGYSESPAPHDNTILWSARVTGELHEFPTPVVYDGMVFYTSDSIGTAETDTLYALSAATGEVIWTYDTGHADDAVTVVDGRLYTSADSIFCLDAYTGDKIWASGYGHRDGSTPIVENGRVFCGDGANIVCLDSIDGNIIWITNLGEFTASCLGLSDDLIFVPTISSSTGLYAMNTETGSIVWQNTDCPGYYWDSSPVIEDGLIYICSIEGYALAIDALTGTTEWISTLAEGVSATPAFHQDRLYFATELEDTYYCLDALNGSTIWTSPYSHHGSSGAADGLVFFGESYPTQDSASVVALDMETGAEVWSYRTSSASIGFGSSPSITDGVMYYACTDGYLYAFGTGLKYTYREDYFYADVGSNKLIVTSFDDGVAVAADTINFTVTQTGITLEPSTRLSLQACPNPFHFSASISFDLSELEWTLVTIMVWENWTGE
ncbi:MAG: PQQ-binding-like beta-propeller repeat protein [Candidatus Aegiribacteria sp.]|nr:PQQ-binding-like beta-propeller repeat protein [Candidatus Aegiribacteria sp.]